MAVAHQLARLIAGGSKSQAIHHIIKPPLQKKQQIFTGNALLLRCFLKIVFKLLFQNAVDAFQSLLFAQLIAIVSKLGAPLRRPCWPGAY